VAGAGGRARSGGGGVLLSIMVSISQSLELYLSLNLLLPVPTTFGWTKKTRHTGVGFEWVPQTRPVPIPVKPILRTRAGLQTHDMH
jgi:hypothetical protein